MSDAADANQPPDDYGTGVQEQTRPDPWVRIAGLAVFTIAFVTFLPVLDNGFVWDDRSNIEENAEFGGLSVDRLAWMFTTFHNGHYQPLSWVTLGVDHVVWGTNPAGYHLTNLVIHSINAVLVYLLAVMVFRLSVRWGAEASPPALHVGAVLTALLFALHPLRVESVAWVTERRDVLSASFILLTVLMYLRACGQGDRGLFGRRLAVVLAAYLLSLLSKAGGMTLPVILLVLDWYPLRRLGGGKGWLSGAAARPVLFEKIPFAVLAIASAVVAGYAQADTGATAFLEEHGILGRCAQACCGLVFYLRATIVPVGLVPLHELHIPIDPLAFRYLVSIVLVAGGGVALLWSALRRPGVTAAFACYAVFVLPVLGFFQSGPQEVAERYSYLSCIGPVMLVGAWYWRSWPFAEAQSRSFSIPVLSVLATVVFAAVVPFLGIMTWRQCGVWRSDLTLWTHAARYVDDSRITWSNLGFFREAAGDVDGAVYAFGKAREIEPLYPELGFARLLVEQGRFAEAIDDLESILIEHTDLAGGYRLLAVSLVGADKPEQAVGRYREALRLEGDALGTRRALARLLHDLGRLSEAVVEYELAVVVEPDDARTLFELGFALQSLERHREAKQCWARAIRINPKVRDTLLAHGIDVEAAAVPTGLRTDAMADDTESLVEKGDRQAAVGRMDLAIVLYDEALRAEPDDALVHYKRAEASRAVGRLAESVTHHERALELEPGLAQAHLGLGMTFGLMDRPESAANHYRQAVGIDPNMMAAHYNLGIVLGHLGKSEEAIEAMERALELAESSKRTDLVPRIRDRLEKLRKGGGARDNPDLVGKDD